MVKMSVYWVKTFISVQCCIIYLFIFFFLPKSCIDARFSIFSLDLRSTLCGGRSLCEKWCPMLPEPHGPNLSLMNPGILEYACAVREENKSIDGKAWSFSISRWSGDLIFSPHNVAEDPISWRNLRLAYGRKESWLRSVKYPVAILSTLITPEIIQLPI